MFPFACNYTELNLLISPQPKGTGALYIYLCPSVCLSVFLSVCRYVRRHLYLRDACTNVYDFIHQDPVQYEDYARPKYFW